MKPGNHDIVEQAKVINFKIQDGNPALKMKFGLSKYQNKNNEIFLKRKTFISSIALAERSLEGDQNAQSVLLPQKMQPSIAV